MKHTWIVLWVLLSAWSVPAKGQQRETTLKGYLGVEGGESYTYKLVFTDSVGIINGYAYTYLFENKEVKATITGTIDRTNRTLSFKETEIVYNHGFESNTTICLINATLKYKMGSDGKEVYSGPITSSDISNVYCGQGTVTFPYTENLQHVFNDTPPAKPAPASPATTSPSKPIRVVYDTVSSVKTVQKHINTSNNEPDKITAGKEKFIEWHSDSLIIEIWDGGRIDGDIVSVRYNATPVFSHLSITKVPHRKVLPVTEKLSTLTVTAINEGNEPPNTADILLIDGTIRHSVIAYNTIGKEAVIKLKKVDK